jgi:glycine cleavage system H protein
MTPNDRKFTKTHEWVKAEGATVTVGLTDYAQQSLGDVTFIELPPVGKKTVKGKGCCVIESVKAASDIYSPVCGEVEAVNKELVSRPETVNADPYGSAWVLKIKDFPASDLDDLMDAKQYDSFVESSR